MLLGFCLKDFLLCQFLPFMHLLFSFNYTLSLFSILANCSYGLDKIFKILVIAQPCCYILYVCMYVCFFNLYSPTTKMDKTFWTYSTCIGRLLFQFMIYWLGGKDIITCIFLHFTSFIFKTCKHWIWCEWLLISSVQWRMIIGLSDPWYSISVGRSRVGRHEGIPSIQPLKQHQRCSSSLRLNPDPEQILEKNISATGFVSGPGPKV